MNYKQINNEFEAGTVIIAGAGPGAIKLLTYRVLNVIKSADVIIYDALVNQSILNFSNAKCKLIYAGKLKDKKACSQKDINDWLVDFANQNLRVLRLKGGDPSFFSRASQEADHLMKHNVKFNVFSGITASQESLKKLHKSFFNNSNFCNLITGHKSINFPSIKINYDSICMNGGRIIIYMGVSQIDKISKKLIESGKNKNTEVSIISNASLESEKIVFTTLEKSSMLAKRKKIKSPAIIVVE